MQRNCNLLHFKIHLRIFNSMKELLKNQSVNLGFNGNNPTPTKEFLAAIDEGEKLAHNPNAKTYSTPQELWNELDI